MNDTLSEAIREAYASCPSNITYLETVEISHPDVSDVFYLVKDRKPWTLTLENGQTKTFLACPFRMTLPQSGENGAQELSIGIDNVDRRVSDYLNAVKESLVPVAITYRVYLPDDTSAPQNNPPLCLNLRDVSVKDAEVQGKAVFIDIINKKFLTELYTRQRFPSLAN